MRTLCAVSIVAWCFAFDLSNARGQNVSVQQPVFRNFSVNTTVSAPDRGRVFVGGVGRAARGGGYQGLAPAGTRTGKETSGGMVEATATIHDLDELDRQVLEAASRKRSAVAERPPQTRADFAFRQLQTQEAESNNEPGEIVEQGATPETEKLVKEGREAAERGRHKLALAYFRVAAQNGSSAARDELQRMRSPVAQGATRRENAANPAEETPRPGSSTSSRAGDQLGGFEAKSNPKRSGSARR